MNVTETFKLENDVERKELSPLFSSDLLAVLFGGGTNSTAMLCGFQERGIKPNLVIFSDTGAEMPHTYKHVEVMAAKVREWWGLELHIVRKLLAGKFEGIDGECERKDTLPALAYGSRACSMKYKHEPATRLLKAEMKTRGVQVVKRAIGFDAGEGHRTRKSPDGWAVNWYPLVEWEWWREECVAAITRHGLPQPGKSSCYFCPAMKRSEVLRLQKENPELLARALEIERKAQATITSPRGTRRTKQPMGDWLAMEAAQSKLMLDIEPHEIPCGCMDG